MEDDVDVSVEVDGDADMLAAGQDFNKMARTHIKAGFREGSVAGHEVGLKEGFRAGIAHGMQCAIQWGIVRGTIQSLLSFCPPKDKSLTAAAEMKLRELLGDLETQEHLSIVDSDTRPLLERLCCLQEVMNSCIVDGQLKQLIERLDSLREQYGLT